MLSATPGVGTDKHDVFLTPPMLGAEKPNRPGVGTAETLLGAPNAITGTDDTMGDLNMSVPPFNSVCDWAAAKGVVLFKSVCNSEGSEGFDASNSVSNP